MSTAPSNDTESMQLDPVFLNSKREAWIILGLWVVALLWSVPYCYFNGFQTGLDPETVETTMGIPSWVFWGIAFPWVVADLFTIWFCLFYMKEDDLGVAHEGEDLAEEIAEMHAADSDATTGGNKS